MIEAKRVLGMVEVLGHADGPEGSIVCSAVSALTQALVCGLEEVTGLAVYEEQQSGVMRICWRTDHRLTREQEALLRTWELAMRGIADSYPEANITITKGLEEGPFLMADGPKTATADSPKGGKE